jgi:hypothetical protein
MRLSFYRQSRVFRGGSRNKGPDKGPRFDKMRGPTERELRRPSAHPNLVSGGCGMSSEPNGYIYFIQAPINDFIKIGYSARHPDGRVAEMQTGCPVILKPLGFLRGSIADERALHARFADSREHGEWFRASEDLMAFIAESVLPWVHRTPDPEPYADGPKDWDAILLSFYAYKWKEHIRIFGHPPVSLPFGNPEMDRRYKSKVIEMVGEIDQKNLMSSP